MAIAAGSLIISPLICFNSTEIKASSSSSRVARGTKAVTSNYRISGRRDLFLLSATALSTYVVIDSRTDLINKYLKKSEENKVRNDKERLDSYYKRNYRDYFGLLEGDLRQKKELSESDQRILEWLQSNK